MNEEEIKPNESEDNPHRGKAYGAFGVIASLVVVSIFLEADFDMDPITLGVLIGVSINFFLWFWLMKVLTDIRDSLRK